MNKHVMPGNIVASSLCKNNFD